MRGSLGALGASAFALMSIALGACASDSRSCFVDGDGDNYGSGPAISTSGTCAAGQVERSGDCDDSDPRVWPGAALHPDCDNDGVFAAEAVVVCGPVVVCRDGGLPDGGFIEELAEGEVADCDDEDPEARHTVDWYPDCDGDGRFGHASERSCGNPGGVCAAGRPPVGGFTTIAPQELVDCDDEDATKEMWATWSADCDGDGFYAPGEETACGEPESPCDEGLPPIGGFGRDLASGLPRDCNDGDAERFPGQRWFPDCDRDGHFAEAPLVSCQLPQSPCADELYPDGGYGHDMPTGDDCDDEDSELFGGQIWYVDCDGDNAFDGEGVISCERPEVCGGEAPQGRWTHAPPALVDCDDTNADLVKPQAWYPDCDDDGAIAPKPVLSCAPPEESPCFDGLPPDGDWTALIAGGFDCDDEAAAYASKRDWYADCDGDGAFSSMSANGCAPPDGVCSDGQPPDGGWSATQPAATMSDCDDDNPERFPGQLWYADCDADDAWAAIPTMSCEEPAVACADGLPPDGGFAHQVTTLDCDDEDPTRIPEDIWYADCDGDGFFRAASVVSCGEPGTICVSDEPPLGGWTRIAPPQVDCQDEDDRAWPGQIWFPDCDGDGSYAATSVAGCMPPSDWLCPDGAPPLGSWVPATNPAEDCDDGDASMHPAQSWYRDCDGDGSFSADALLSCGTPNALCDNGSPPIGGWSDRAPLPGLEDCDDASASRSPSHVERCFDGLHADGVDDDCDGVTDDGCPIIHSVDIAASESWQAGEHVVTGPIALRGATLSILAGAHVTFFPGASLTIGPSGGAAATLVVSGDRQGAGPAVFTRDTTWSDTSAAQPGDWGGLLLGPEADGSTLSGADIEFATAALSCDRADNVTLSDLRLRFNQGSGLDSSWCEDLTVDGIVATFNGGSGVDLGVGTRAVVRSSELRNNAQDGLTCHGTCMARGADGAVLPETFTDNTITSNAQLAVSGMSFIDWPALSPTSTYTGNGIDAIIPPTGIWESGPFDLHWRKLDVPYRFDYFVRFGAPSETTLTIDGGTVLEFGETGQFGIGTDATDRRAVLLIDHSESADPVVFRPAPAGAVAPIHLLLGAGLNYETSTISGLDVHEGYIEIAASAPAIARLSRITVEGSSGAGVLVSEGSAVFNDLEVSACVNGLSFVCDTGCSLDLDASYLHDNSGYGVECAGGCAPHQGSWSGNTFEDNALGATN